MAVRHPVPRSCSRSFLIFPLFYAFGMSLFTLDARDGHAVHRHRATTSRRSPIRSFLEGLLRVARVRDRHDPGPADRRAGRRARARHAGHPAGEALSRLLIFAPYAIPVVIGALMWSFLYSPRFGPARTLFELVRPADAGLPRLRHDLLQPRQHRHVAVVGLLHDRHLRGAAVDRPVDLRGGAHRRRERLADRDRASRCR